MKRSLVAAVLALAACGTKRVNYCSSDADCKDPAYPFCDVNGEYPASDGEKNSCTVVPDNCPVDRCGCTPNAVLSCSGNQVTTCAADGKSTTTDTCALGCASDGTRCLTFDPSNGLGGALAMAAGEPDIVLPSGAKIDTDLGLVQDSAGNAIAVTSVLVAQSDGSMVRVFEGNSFVMDDVVVTGSHAFAAVAPGAITVRGHFDASANTVTNGAGAQEPPMGCVGATTQIGPSGCTSNCGVKGAGGGGNAVPGGAGGNANTSGGLGGGSIAGFVPLAGGCRGGAVLDTSGAVSKRGGAGGGAVQLVSVDQIMLTNSGLIDVGGGGGESSAGGGSGGVVVLEAPTVIIDGAAAGVAANGGAGGGCSATGADATPDTTAAPAASCGSDSPGAGGTAAAVPGWGAECTGTCFAAFYGGGGGAAGRMRVATKDGTYTSMSNPILSVMISTGTLVAK